MRLRTRVTFLSTADGGRLTATGDGYHPQLRQGSTYTSCVLHSVPPGATFEPGHTYDVDVEPMSGQVPAGVLEFYEGSRRVATAGPVIRTEAAVIALIESDPEAMPVLRAAAALGLPDWWIGAGFLRNRVWNALTGRPAEPDRDVDVAYFDPADLDPATETAAETRAATLLPGRPWEIRNQARMHLRNGVAPYTSTLDAISHWPETATCVAVTLRAGRVALTCCHGPADLLDMVVRPSPAFDTPSGRAKVEQRLTAKGWLTRWPGLRLEI
ncbi:MAG TPA: nucleotidyltransferase family protein [Actinoplanes sp.]|nr:nucleotidyltransferase family protein [Actinoplanes sp.]